MTVQELITALQGLPGEIEVKTEGCCGHCYQRISSTRREKWQDPDSDVWHEHVVIEGI